MCECEYLMENAGVVGMHSDAYGEDNVCYMRFSFATATETLESASDRIKAPRHLWQYAVTVGDVFFQKNRPPGVNPGVDFSQRGSELF